jgi:hypothetical protein
MAGARQVVDGPAYAGLPYGLWDSIQQRDVTDQHWRNGVTWSDICPSQTSSTAYDSCIAVTGTGGAPPANSALSSNVTLTNRGATPFTVYAEFDCSPIGLDSLGERALAETNLARVERNVVAAAFWSGQAAGQSTVWPHLAASSTLSDPNGILLQPAATQAVTGTGVDAATSLGILENQLAACYGGQGVIHVPYLALPTLRAWRLAKPGDDGKLYTPAGNLVVASGGYPGTSPAGASAASGNCWIYATGQVFGYRSDVQVMQLPGTFDRAKNTEKRLAMRTYLFGFECCLLAAQMALGVPT